MAQKEIYLKISEIAKLSGCSINTLKKRCQKNNSNYIIKLVKGRGGQQYQIAFSSLESELQEKIKLNKPELFLTTNSQGGTSILLRQTDMHSNAPVFLDNEISAIIPEKAKKLALAKVDLIEKWEKHRKHFPDKKSADNDFIALYNNKMLSPLIYSVVGKVSIKSLYRWNKELIENGGDYRALVPNYKYRHRGEIITPLSPQEQEYFKTLMLNDAKLSVGAAYRLIKHKIAIDGLDIKQVSKRSYERFAQQIKRNEYDTWVMMREGKKALAEKVLPYIMRSVNKLKVGDVLIADGNVLDFMVINPYTGRPCRAVMVAYQDWASADIAGYEIMITENTQCIASALRNSIIRLGKIPKIAYQDNGKAFKSKFFNGDVDLEECGFNGIFKNLGIEPVYAMPYNAKAKPIERFFGEFTRTFSKLMVSYIGNNIENKPAHLKRNEKFHKENHSKYVPNINETVAALEKWLEFYRSQPCPHAKGKTIGEVFNEGRGKGVNVDTLDDLLMAQETRKVGRNGIKLFNQFYYSEELYGINDTVIVKYSFLDVFRVRIYSLSGEFICEARAVKEEHPMAAILGDNNDYYSLQRAIKDKNRLEKTTIKNAKALMRFQNKEIGWNNGAIEGEVLNEDEKRVTAHRKMLPDLSNIKFMYNDDNDIKDIRI